MKIHILADEVASQIAAGEVIERPASVVKELLENAIDAGADRITIRIEDAGKKCIEVADNGVGIPSGELSLAVARHATSKLQSAEDLFHIHTLGFRGEALASIGSVSRMTIISRNAGEESGATVLIEGGKILRNEMSGGITGTVVRVEDLFFNTPARLKFLKRDQTEKQQIDGLVTRYALAYPGKAIHLEEDGKPILRTTGNGNHREILAQLYGVELAKQLLEVTFEEEEFRINGYISPISVNRANRKDITFFVNGRWIQDTALTAALTRAYQTYLMVGRYPLAVLFIELPSEDVDVNVHPAKAEVRFRQPDVIFAMLQRAVRRALLAYSPVPVAIAPSWRVVHPEIERTFDWKNGDSSWDSSGQGSLPQSETRTLQDDQAAPVSTMPLLRLIGQIGATYLVAEGPDGLYLIDQHAAHERVLYEQMVNKPTSITSQALLEPAILQLPPQSSRLLVEQLPVLNQIGFQIEEFGQNSFRLSAIPALFSQGDPLAAVRSVVEDFEEDETPLQGMLREKLIARICKRMAIKGGMLMSPDEQAALVRGLEACVSPRTCPHGRPTMIHLPVDLLERQFGRRGARSF